MQESCSAWHAVGLHNAVISLSHSAMTEGPTDIQNNPNHIQTATAPIAIWHPIPHCDRYCDTV